MKKLGIVRRIDDIGRVNIPKSLRNELGIKPGEAIEFAINEEGNLVLLPYQTWEEHVIRWVKQKEKEGLFNNCNFTEIDPNYTSCVITFPNGYTRCGVAKRHKGDTWNYKIAQAASYARAIGKRLDSLVGWEG